ncbi:MAG: hypothetical protein KBD01_16520 [Acidobacteria bacterium]|nr:hypothetical protein [Acidobacteriota bacterium]
MRSPVLALLAAAALFAPALAAPLLACALAAPAQRCCCGDEAPARDCIGSVCPCSVSDAPATPPASHGSVDLTTFPASPVPSAPPLAGGGADRAPAVPAPLVAPAPPGHELFVAHCSLRC